MDYETTLDFINKMVYAYGKNVATGKLVALLKINLLLSKLGMSKITIAIILLLL